MMTTMSMKCYEDPVYAVVESGEYDARVMDLAVLGNIRCRSQYQKGD